VKETTRILVRGERGFHRIGGGSVSGCWRMETRGIRVMAAGKKGGGTVRKGEWPGGFLHISPGKGEAGKKGCAS